MWILFALLSALFASLSNIFSKIGVSGVNSNVATSVRTLIALIMSILLVFLTKAQQGYTSIDFKNWLFLILSGISIGFCWLSYHRALQLADVSKVIPLDKMSVVITLVLSALLLKEPFTLKTFLGCILLVSGILTIIS